MSGTWRRVDTPPAPGAWNMAVDEALMDTVRRGGDPLLRFYRWEPRCLSLGRNQPAIDRYRLDELERRGIDLVRRPTGGRAVLHGHELTYSAILPEDRFRSAREAYIRINQALVAGLRRLGVRAYVHASEQRAAEPSASPCFREAASGEVALEGRKLIGSAQITLDGVLLQHGSLLLTDEQSEIPELMVEPVEAAAPATLADALPALPAWGDLVAALSKGWTEVIGPLRDSELSEHEREAAGMLRDVYADPVWTFKR